MRQQTLDESHHLNPAVCQLLDLVRRVDDGRTVLLQHTHASRKLHLRSCTYAASRGELVAASHGSSRRGLVADHHVRPTSTRNVSYRTRYRTHGLGHKRSHPTRSKLLGRRACEWQLSGQLSENRGGSARPSAVADEGRLACASPGMLTLTLWRCGVSNPNVGSRRQAPTDRRPTGRLRHRTRLETVRAHPNRIQSCTPPAGAAFHYERHRPEQTTLYAWCSNTPPVSSRTPKPTPAPSCRPSSRTSSTPSSSAAFRPMAS